MTLETALVSSAVDPDISAAMVVFDRLNPLKEALGLENLTDPEMQLFAMVAHHTGLDPFTKQIYAIKRAGKVTHQTGIDGYRSSAERTKEYAGSDEATFEGCDCASKDSPPEHPKIARVVVHRILPSGHTVNQVGIARWHELKPDHKQSKSGYSYADDMWWAMPYNQLAKCAEANGLRKAFPRVLGGVYIAEEMQQAETVEGQVTVLPTASERIAARRAQAEVVITDGDDTATGISEPDIAATAAAPEESAPSGSGSTPAPSTYCLAETEALDTGKCALAPGHDGPHRNQGGVWPA